MVATLLFCSVAVFSQNDRVYLKNGELYKGQVTAIHNDFILLETSERIFSINREDIQYVFRENRKQSSLTTVKNSNSEDHQEDYFEPVEGRFITEFGIGAYTFSPFAYNVSLREWYAINENINVGLGVSLDFFSAYMLKISGHARYLFQGSRSLRPYLSAGLGVGPLVGNINGFRTDVLVNYSPVVQPVAGFGCWLESGLKVAFTGEVGINFTAYSAQKEVQVNNGIRYETGQYRNMGPYIRLGMAF